YPIEHGDDYELALAGADRMTRRMFGCAQHHVIAALGVERHTASKHGSKRSRPYTRRNDGAVARIGLSFGRDLVQSGRRLAKSGCAHLREPAPAATKVSASARNSRTGLVTKAVSG